MMASGNSMPSVRVPKIPEFENKQQDIYKSFAKKEGETKYNWFLLLLYDIVNKIILKEEYKK